LRPASLLPTIIAAALWHGTAQAQCTMELGEDLLVGNGSGVRVAIDPTTEAPVLLIFDQDDGLVYRRFLGPGWGREIRVGTGSVDPHPASFDFTIDAYGRPRVGFWDTDGAWQTRYTDAWSGPDQLLARNMGQPTWSKVDVRMERDDADGVHAIYVTNVDSKKSWHAYDDGSGFPAGVALLDDGGRSPRAVADADRNLHLTMVRPFDDPDSEWQQYQAYYQVWTPENGWPPVYEVYTDEDNPPADDTGPIGHSPEISLDAQGMPHIVYPMFSGEDFHDSGEVHAVSLTSSGWSEPEYLFDCWGHSAYPRFLMDARETRVAVGMTNEKVVSVDFGDGWSEPFSWQTDTSNVWALHDLEQTRGLFWHPYHAAEAGDNGEIRLQTFSKIGACPGISDDDLDDDGVADAEDLCPDFPDPMQGDQDGDGLGDACDPDDDDDGFLDEEDVCPRLSDPWQEDSDGDGLGDACSELVDGDGDGLLKPWDCDDSDAAVGALAAEVCDDQVDNDCDGDLDMDDADCWDTERPDDTALGTDGDGGCGCHSRGGSRPGAGLLLLLGALLGGVLRRGQIRAGRP